MEVFRICSKEEINKIINSIDLSHIGSLGSTYIKYNNTHSYIPNERYLHFFKEKDSVLYWYPKEGRYICTYNIPDDILVNYIKTGKYISLFNFNRDVDVYEYAIPSNIVKKDYLVKIELLKETIDICDDDYYYSFDDSCDIIYEQDKNNKTLIKTNK